jgi:elongin-A
VGPVFEGFGDVPFELYEPLLQECPAETLERLEEYTPVMQSILPLECPLNQVQDLSTRTQRKTSPFLDAVSLYVITDCWKTICKREYPRFSDMIDTGELGPPACWKEHFYVSYMMRPVPPTHTSPQHLKEWHQQRLEAVGERMREQRQAAEVQKKERQTIFVEPIVRKMRNRELPLPSIV